MNDWKNATLEQISNEIFSGGTPSTKDESYWDGNIPWTTTKIIDGVTTDSGEKTISELGLNNSSTKVVPKNNLIIGSRVGVGKATVNTLDLAINQDLTGVVLDHESVSPTFIAYQLSSHKIQSYFKNVARGTTIKGVSRSDINNISLNIPPLEEQKKIAAVLITVQNAIEKSSVLISKTQLLKTSLLNEIFTYGLEGLNGINTSVETSNKPMPKNWNEITLGEVVTLQRGKDLPKNKRENGEYPVVGSNGIVGVHKDMTTTGPGVAVGRSGSAGLVTWVETDYWALNTSLYVKDFHGFNPLFVYYLLTWLDLSQYASGASVPTLNRNIVHPLKIRVPSDEEQNEIAESLFSVDKRITALTKQRDSIQKIFNSLLENLMSAEIRVNDLDIDYE